MDLGKFCNAGKILRVADIKKFENSGLSLSCTSALLRNKENALILTEEE